jgi:hypothetical protein
VNNRSSRALRELEGRNKETARVKEEELKTAARLLRVQCCAGRSHLSRGILSARQYYNIAQGSKSPLGADYDVSNRKGELLLTRETLSKELSEVMTVVSRFEDGKDDLDRELSVRRGPVKSKDRSSRKGHEVRIAWMASSSPD